MNCRNITTKDRKRKRFKVPFFVKGFSVTLKRHEFNINCNRNTIHNSEIIENNNESVKSEYVRENRVSE